MIMKIFPYPGALVVVDQIQAIRGMNDILPCDIPLWQQIEKILISCAEQYGFQEIRLPLLESTWLFRRSIGEITDIVEKEMYTFIDLNGDSLSLRPEGTASCLRACLEHGLLHNQHQKLWYMGPMFRREKPQKGRYRQFNQFGVEALGISSIAIELELLALCQRLWKYLGIDKNIELQINTLGTLEERQLYREKLVEYFTRHVAQLDKDSQSRLHKNPLRILDSKNPELQHLINSAPQLFDFLSPASKNRFITLCTELQRLGIVYTVNPFLVRGLDYYDNVVFEWNTNQLGSQATVCAGGRYDNLIKQLGGKSCAAVGFSIGIERLVLLMKTLHLSLPLKKTKYLFFIIADGAEPIRQALHVAEILRNEKKWNVIINFTGGSFKSQFKKADKSGAAIALILGESEAQAKQIAIKNLRNHQEQVTILQQDVVSYLHKYIT